MISMKKWRRFICMMGGLLTALTLSVNTAAASSDTSSLQKKATNSSAMANDASSESSELTEFKLSDSAASSSSTQQDADSALEAATDNAQELASDQESESVATPTTDSVQNARNGIVQVNAVFVDDAGNKNLIQGGAGFIIGSAEDSEYVITCEHIIAPDTETKEAAFSYYGIKNENDSWDKIDVQIEVVTESDVVISASVLNTSDSLDLAVLELSQPIYTRTPLTFLVADSGESEAPYKVTDEVFAMGYPYEVIFEQNPVYYSNDEVSMSSGHIANLTTIGSAKLIQHNAAISRNNCGGPLLNKDGLVIGVNALLTDGNNYYSIDATQLTKILDSLGISYNAVTADEWTEYVNSQNASTEESTAADAATLATSTEVIDTGHQDDPTPAWVIVLVTLLGVLLTGIVFVLIILLIKKSKSPAALEKKKARELKKQQKREEMTIPPMNRYGEDAPKQNTYKPMSHDSYPMQPKGGQGETSILSQNVQVSSETTILGTSNTPMQTMYFGALVRRKGGENISINKTVFIIGKDSLHVDYCIKDNSAVSRQHVVIRSGGNGIYAEDMGSTNGTYVNNTRLMQGTPVELKSGDVIKIANEEFDFRK